MVRLTLVGMILLDAAHKIVEGTMVWQQPIPLGPEDSFHMIMYDKMGTFCILLSPGCLPFFHLHALHLTCPPSIQCADIAPCAVSFRCPTETGMPKPAALAKLGLAATTVLVSAGGSANKAMLQAEVQGRAKEMRVSCAAEPECQAVLFLGESTTNGLLITRALL